MLSFDDSSFAPLFSHCILQGLHKKEIEVVDLFEDKSFGSPDAHNLKSWFIPGDPVAGADDVDKPPFKWDF